MRVWIWCVGLLYTVSLACMHDADTWAAKTMQQITNAVVMRSEAAACVKRMADDVANTISLLQTHRDTTRYMHTVEKKPWCGVVRQGRYEFLGECSISGKKYESYIEGLINRELYDKNTIIFVTVHGSHGSPNSLGFDLTRPESQAFVQYMRALSHEYKAAVLPVHFKWPGMIEGSGCTVIAHHKEAGGHIAKHIDSLCAEIPSITKLFALAHSHGCNVVRFAAQSLRETARTVDTAIFMASPGLEDRVLGEPLNIQNIYHFYSTGDLVQVGGSAHTCWSMERKIKRSSGGDEAIWNVRIQYNGEEPHHNGIKYCVLKNLPHIIKTINNGYRYIVDLDAAVGDRHDPLVAIRNQNDNNTFDLMRMISDEQVSPTYQACRMVALAQELSRRDELLFSARYGRAIGDKGTAWGRVGRLACAYIPWFSTVCAKLEGHEISG